MNTRFIAYLILVTSTLCLHAQAIVLDSQGVYHRVEEGTLLEGSLNVRNEKTEAINLIIQKSSVSNDSTNGLEWLKFDEYQIPLAPNESKEITYLIDVPKGSQGQLTSKVGFKTEGIKKKGESPLDINTRISIYFIAVVKGTEIYECDIEEIKVSSNDPNILLLKTHNKGNVYIKPQGTAVIKNHEGTVVTQGSVNERGIVVFTDQARMLSAELDNPLAPGNYELEVVFSSASGDYKIEKNSFFEIPEGILTNTDGT